MNKTALIIGSGFSGLSAAAFMAKAGWKTTVLEKHSTPGGRARQLSSAGFHFDMGPSWYWMPDVFERFFASFGKRPADYYTLRRLDPSYRVVWPDGHTDIPAGYPPLQRLFEQWEPGAAKKLDAFLQEAAFKYRVGMGKLVYQPGQSWKEFANLELIKGVLRLDVFRSIKTHISRYFSHPRIRQLLEFPVLFLGALPEETPALYSLMNYADICGGTWYPEGGLYSVVKAMHALAMEQGVAFQFDEEVTSLEVRDKKITSVMTASGSYAADVVIASADYHFVEQTLLPLPYRTYTEQYWNSRKLAPSCLLYFVGLNKKLTGAQHHTLFFDTPFEQHANEIYQTKSWPAEPLFYVSVTSVTDPSSAPPGGENLFFLVPVASGLEDDTPEKREKYFMQILERYERHTGETIRDSIVYKSDFAVTDFAREYHSFKGNAYGLANTLRQTALFKPSCSSNKINNLYYTGQLTVPGPGVPPSLISGEVVAQLATQAHKKYFS